MNYSLIKFIGQSIEIFFMNYCYHGDIKGGAYKLIHMQLLVNVRFSNLFKMTKKADQNCGIKRPLHGRFVLTRHDNI